MYLFSSFIQFNNDVIDKNFTKQRFLLVLDQVILLTRTFNGFICISLVSVIFHRTFKSRCEKNQMRLQIVTISKYFYKFIYNKL